MERIINGVILGLTPRPGRTGHPSKISYSGWMYEEAPFQYRISSDTWSKPAAYGKIP
jgi:hypothetical protein